MLLEEIAEAGELPPRFLAQIFQRLRRHDLVRSHRGAVRGYSLTRHPGEVRLGEIFEAIEGPGLFERCLFWPGRCSVKAPCDLHPLWSVLRPRLRQMLQETALADVAAPRAGGEASRKAAAPPARAPRRRAKPGGVMSRP